MSQSSIAKSDDRYDAERAGEVVELLFPDEEDRRRALRHFADAIRLANDIEPGGWVVTLLERRGKPIVRLNSGVLAIMTLHKGKIDTLVESTLIDEELRGELEEWRWWALGQAKIHPTFEGFLIPIERFPEFEPRLKDAWVAAQTESAGARRSSSYRQAYSPGVLKYIESELGVTLPRPPTLEGPPRDEARFASFCEFVQCTADATEFDDELAFKDECIGRLETSLRAVQTGSPEWRSTLREAFGKNSNLTSWRVHNAFLDWCDESPEEARTGLLALWDPDEELATRLTAFFDAIPVTVLRDAPGTRLSVASFLLMASDGRALPLYRAQTMSKVLSLAGHTEPSRDEDVVGFYVHAVEFFEELAASVNHPKIATLLPAQSAAFLVATAEHLPGGTPELDRAFRQFRGLEPPAEVSDSDPEGSTASSSPPVPANPPARVASTTTNLILFGPPGTGKTYSTVERAVRLIDGKAPAERTGTTARFNELMAAGQVEVVTFHQAYGYEEFVEGIRPVLGNASTEVKYELHAGAFRRIALRAAAEGLRRGARTPSFETLWTTLVEEIEAEDQRIESSARGKHYVLEVSQTGRSVRAYPATEGDDGDWLADTERRQSTSKELVRIWWNHRDEIGPKMENITYQRSVELLRDARGGGGGHHYSPLWICYRLLCDIADRIEAAQEEHQAPSNAEVLAALNDRSAEFEFGEDANQYVLVIDEINRGNISKILGELITLLEPDKRLGAANELRLPLVYSPHQKFGVPPNLHVIGTMNTADRSIALMDVALRRRFLFEEVMPSSEVVADVLQAHGVRRRLVALVADLLDTMNARIRFLYDRDHQLGHSMFLGVRSLADVRDVLVGQVIPLLQEYFYGSWDKVSIVLGCARDEDGRPRSRGRSVGREDYVRPVLSRREVNQDEVLGFSLDEFEAGFELELNPLFVGASGAELAAYLVGVLGDGGFNRHSELVEVASE